MGSRVAVFPPGRQDLYTRNRYSAAVASGGFLFVSGQVGSREDGTPEPDIEAQFRLAFQNLNAVLAAGGCSFADVVDFTMYMVDPQRDFRLWNAVVPEFWGEPPYPTATVVGVTWLAGFQFELKVTAKIPEEAARG